MSIAEIVDKHGNHRENLLNILHDIQDFTADNSLHQNDLQQLSQIMCLPVSEIVGTASFYTMFSLQPRGRHVIRLCESPPCYIKGADNILRALEQKLGVKVGQTTQDHMFTLETTSCLGVCGVAPAMMIDEVVYGNLTEAKVKTIIDEMMRQSA
ncbi:MAG: NADH-quinone oxidoreductase subunit NuoE [Kiritimatiellia bacterium]|nr:NADH-quinone oxidoreductase subunit NuoE [Lentisphaerota bacterium]